MVVILAGASPLLRMAVAPAAVITMSPEPELLILVAAVVVGVMAEPQIHPVVAAVAL